jgi:hypothetical protein
MLQQKRQAVKVRHRKSKQDCQKRLSLWLFLRESLVPDRRNKATIGRAAMMPALRGLPLSMQVSRVIAVRWMAMVMALPVNLILICDPTNERQISGL